MVAPTQEIDVGFLFVRKNRHSAVAVGLRCVFEPRGFTAF